MVKAKLLTGLSTLVLLLGNTFALPILAHAEGGSDNSGSGSSNSGSDDSNESDDSSVDDKKVEEAKDRSRKKARDMVKDLDKKKERTEKRSEARKKYCEEKQNGIKNKGSKLGTNASRHLEKFSNLLTKAEDFKTKNNLSPDNYDGLVAAAKTAKAKAEESIAALKALSGTVDCSSENVAEQVATIKAAAEQARADLKAYRKAVKAVFKALKDTLEAQQATDNTNPANDDGTADQGSGDR